MVLFVARRGNAFRWKPSELEEEREGFRFGRSDHRDGIIPLGWPHQKSAIEIQSEEIENLRSENYDIYFGAEKSHTAIKVVSATALYF